ncbi:hypothetical protein CDCA_CDCA13G3572 [Cyanidium caldarium]|uniref:phosphoribosylanthranilate isomerase n=1 Tax=Cyanidium caldarium TaxID=2771 RepID=A0AAV9IZ19_CYACA|nr:hypothetical protein CDCA_CDCA13G3572 [Cyanidium caldarium]
MASADARELSAKRPSSSSSSSRGSAFLCSLRASDAAPRLRGVKVCGVTHPEDAAWIVETACARLNLARAAAAMPQIFVGCILWARSRRVVTAAEACGIAVAVREAAARALPRRRREYVRPVAVFVDEPAEHIARTCEQAEMGIAQLHGTSAWQQRVLQEMRQLYGGRWPEWLEYAAVHKPGDATVRPMRSPTSPPPPPPPPPLYRLVDPGRGDGRALDWHAHSWPASDEMWMLAGGLHAGNVGEAVRIVRPPGVDVATGVEWPPSADVATPARPRKARHRLEAFFDAIREAYHWDGTEDAVRASGDTPP